MPCVQHVYTLPIRFERFWEDRSCEVRQSENRPSIIRLNQSESCFVEHVSPPLATHSRK